MRSILSHIKIKNQYLICLLSVGIVASLCLLTRDFLDHKVVGYLLLVVVSLLAMSLDILPVLLSAVLSALILNFFFIQPYYTFHINSPDDSLLLFLFFMITLVNGVLTHKIRKAEKRLQIKEVRVNTMKLYNALLDSLSHELRTPISAIMGAIDTIQSKTVHISEKNRQQLYLEIEKASLRLNHQVENLLNMSRLESGVVQPKVDWCDLKELIYNVLDHLKEDLHFHKVVVDVDENLPLFKLDYGLTEQIIYNLVFNASQYTPKGAKIEVKIEYNPDVDLEYNPDKSMPCLITIADDGSGFPEEEIDKVFDKFYRLQNSKTGGTGLGLSIVKGFVEAQNGQITLENREEGGSIFTIGFPALVMNTKEISNE
ncbi:two-component system, OmpR family, sensor histidine kinase KdpD [Flavobacterium fluvii]|uniref:histidine kinase n=1 Tax=Flavobacterium fluvii TaxID=468056 RepID=A0A1M5LNV6_9FLAO|nr:ATP-binding protein [Flavobacterium fluvii]SHG66033.1 two-component system, OmpR family, sensor histidine kinase KdpD [Flavobacterium fluvii]